MEPLRLGIVGVGGMGGQHLTNAKDLEGVRFTALADSRAAVVAAKSAEHGIPGFPSAEALIDSGLCEAVLIAAPHPYHAPIAEYAASKGLHVLTEKPIAVSVSEADRMIAACERAGVLLGVMFQQRTMPLYRTAKEIVESGALGRL
jgi:predicted dehydrogenase